MAGEDVAREAGEDDELFGNGEALPRPLIRGVKPPRSAAVEPDEPCEGAARRVHPHPGDPTPLQR